VDPVSPPPAPALEVARAASQSQAAEIADRGGQLLAVTQAELCRSLATGGEGGWRCDSVTSPVEPGPLVFYIRVRSATDRTIQHRWYRDDRLSRAVDLRIAANTGAGYRTYSRNTVTGSGDWRVEVTTGDGTLLAEERFTVR
jgi:hypothetical protein